MTTTNINTASVNVRTRQGGTLTRASRQWAERPEDERFDSLEALHAATLQHRMNSATAKSPVGELDVLSADGEVLLRGRSGSTAGFTHWGFGQMSRIAGAPASYLRKLPADLAADNLRHGLKTAGAAGGSDVKLLFRQNGSLRVRAATSERYARIWNHEIAETLLDLQATQPHWTFPTAFKRAGGGSVASAWGAEQELPVAFASDHDMFVFLCDYEHGVRVPGQEHPLARGFWIENSEVGASAVRVTLFLFDFVCCNVLVWGAKNVVEISVRHVGKARKKVLSPSSEAMRSLATWANASPREDEERIARAQNLLIADSREDVVSKLFRKRINGLSKTTIDAAYQAAEDQPRYGDPRSVWGMVNGLTEVSQKTTYTDQRSLIDRAAGKIMEIAF